jgi:hypothetical protein|mmetsp:Transcript_15982/g.35764  ORF Transcript_15982/g.35764 Transcript_15982/m.35764 type:complete len:207 (-) Transcript_15982:58-678(-)
MEKELRERFELQEDLDLKEVVPRLATLKERLPPRSFAFLLTLCEPIFSRLDPELVNVEAMVRSLESAMLHTIDWCRKSNSLTEPDLLFEPLMDKLAAMLRDVVPNPSQCIDSARKRANAEAQADQLAAAADAKAAAKMAKKEAAKKEAAARRERKKGGKPGALTLSDEVRTMSMNGSEGSTTSSEGEREREREPTGSAVSEESVGA